MSAYIILIGVPIAAFLATFFITFRLATEQSRAGITALWVVWAAFTAAMFFGMEGTSGWDGLGYLLALLGISAPSGVAALIGGLAGWAKSEKAIHA